VIDLSADLGEGAAGEEEIWPLVHSANVACGGHVGDEASMRQAAMLAQRYGVRLGAHPSYPDRENFGRVTMNISTDELRSSLKDQIAALASNAPLHHVKPHGALYNDAHRDRTLAAVVLDAIGELAIVCSDSSAMAAVARERGNRVIREAFADRRYEPDGSLVSRKLPGSLLTIDEAAEQARSLAQEAVVIARDGSRITIPFDTICIHADMEHAVERLRAISLALA